MPHVVASCLVLTERYQLSLDILENLSKVQRFQTIAMFLGKQDKAGELLLVYWTGKVSGLLHTELSAALGVLEKWEGSSSSSIGSLRKTYGVNL